MNTPEGFYIIRPDKHHESRCSPKRNNEGAEDRQSQEVREDPAAAVSAWTLARCGCQVDWTALSQRYAPAIVKHLKTNENIQFIREEEKTVMLIQDKGTRKVEIFH